MDRIDLTGKTALITGASRGIGAAAAKTLAEAGASVVLAARGTEAIETLAAEIRAAGGVASSIGCDVSRYADMEAAVALAVQAHGGLDILVNNAGMIDPIETLPRTDPAAWARLIDVNVTGVYNGIRASAAALAARGDGRIVNISSGAATGNVPGWSAYCASKAAVLSLTRHADMELSPQGIRVVGLSPGTVATRMQREIKASGVDNRVRQLEWEDHIPPEWPARAILWLCGPAGAAHAGGDVSLREPQIRDALDLPRG